MTIDTTAYFALRAITGILSLGWFPAVANVGMKSKITKDTTRLFVIFSPISLVSRALPHQICGASDRPGRKRCKKKAQTLVSMLLLVRLWGNNTKVPTIAKPWIMRRKGAYREFSHRVNKDQS